MRVPLPAAFLAAPLAHRAYHNRAEGRVENSGSAIRAAIHAGYGIEIDLQLSRDGVAMVFHDERMERLTEATGFVKDYSAAELSQIRLRDSSDRVPTLAEVLELVGGKVPLLIEIKDQTDQMEETDGRLEQAAAGLLASYAGPLAVMSFNPHSIAHMAGLLPQVARGLTTSAYDPGEWAPLPRERCDALRGIADYDRTQSSFISHEAADLASPRVAELKAQGAAILCWTIRSPEDEAEARKIAHNITFEGYPARLNP